MQKARVINQIKRKFGIALSTLGLIIIATLLAMFFLMVVREFSGSRNLAFLWRSDFLYVLPVLLFLFPGIYFVHIGRKMARGESIGLMPCLEIAIMLIIGFVLIYLNLRADSDSVDQTGFTAFAHFQPGHGPHAASRRVSDQGGDL